ncbi:hypothetical protein SRHO_G00115830 [Serrasalmus rhombeus]
MCRFLVADCEPALDAQSTFIQQVSDYRKASVMDDVLAALLSLGSISDPMEAQREQLWLLESEVECEGFTAVNAAGHVSQDEAFSHVVAQELLST